jgi:soluble cytochrome b562
VEVIVIGLRPGWRFPHKQRDWIDDLDSYRAFFQQLDISLAPIVANPFSLYRSDVKALEAAMGLAAPVLSDVPPYADWDDTRSMKCKDAKGFYHAIKHLVTHRDEAKQLAQAARDYTLKERTTSAQIHLWKEAIAG